MPGAETVFYAMLSVSPVFRCVPETPGLSVNIGALLTFSLPRANVKLTCFGANEIPLILCGGFGNINLLPPTVEGLLITLHRGYVTLQIFVL